MATDPRAPDTLRHPEDTPTTFGEVVRILQGPDKPICAVRVFLCTDGKYNVACDTLEYRIETDKIYFEDFEVYSHDLLYINWHRNRFSFVLVVYRISL
jgi:hypothetical protein